MRWEREEGERRGKKGEVWIERNKRGRKGERKETRRNRKKEVR